MTYRLDDKWVWDCWFARDGSGYHIFFLQAPRALGDPNLRHRHAVIGHAVSQDLINWQTLPDALEPSREKDAWDNLATWTGSVIRHDGTWFMFYTGINREETGLIQRIGLATSDDLIVWERFSDDPVIHIDPCWYEELDIDMWHEQVWRDPWVFQHGGSFHALITARSIQGHRSARGVIGYASSPDLYNWSVQAPITEPGEFGNLEVPQIVHMGNYWYLIFSVEYSKFSKSRLEREGIKPQTGTHYLISKNPFGPYTFLTDNFLSGDEMGTKYSGKIILGPKDDWVLMASNLFLDNNLFLGEISNPIPIIQRLDGAIILQSDLREK